MDRGAARRRTTCTSRPRATSRVTQSLPPLEVVLDDPVIFWAAFDAFPRLLSLPHEIDPTARESRCSTSFSTSIVTSLRPPHFIGARTELRSRSSTDPVYVEAQIPIAVPRASGSNRLEPATSSWCDPGALPVRIRQLRRPDDHSSQAGSAGVERRRMRPRRSRDHRGRPTDARRRLLGAAPTSGPWTRSACSPSSSRSTIRPSPIQSSGRRARPRRSPFPVEFSSD